MRVVKTVIAQLFVGPLVEFAWWLMCRTHWVHIPDRPSDSYDAAGLWSGGGCDL